MLVEAAGDHHDRHVRGPADGSSRPFVKRATAAPHFSCGQRRRLSCGQKKTSPGFWRTETSPGKQTKVTAKKARDLYILR
jgi:hypothetical protein